MTGMELVVQVCNEQETFGSFGATFPVIIIEARLLLLEGGNIVDNEVLFVTTFLFSVWTWTDVGGVGGRGIVHGIARVLR